MTHPTYRVPSVPLAILAAALVAAAPATARSLRVATYNIHGGMGPQVPHIGPIPFPVATGAKFLDLVADEIRHQSIDIAGLQEVRDRSLASGLRDQAEHIARRIGYHVHYVVASSSRWGIVNRQGNAVIARWKILEARSVPLQTSKAGVEMRNAVAARVGVPGLGRGPWIACTHLDARSEATRMEQVGRLGRLVSGLSGPVVLLGDLNSRPGSRPITTILSTFRTADGQALSDTWAAAGQGARNTIPHDGPRVKIDWILATPGLTPLWSRVLTSVRYSDHLPVVTSFALPAPVAPPAAAVPPAAPSFGDIELVGQPTPPQAP